MPITPIGDQRHRFVHIYTFAAERNRIFASLRYRAEELHTVSQIRLHARQAAVALLKMAKTTTDPKLAARLVEAAADLKDQAGELPRPLTPKAPDVQPEG